MNDNKSDESDREVLNVSQAAEFLGVSEQSVYESAGRLEIPHRRLGKRILFSRSGLVAWLSSGIEANAG